MQPAVVERIEPEALRRPAATPIPDGSSVVEVVDRHAHDGSAGGSKRFAEFVGEGRLARAIRAVDADQYAIRPARDGTELANSATTCPLRVVGPARSSSG
jgi:hypothetical protein